MGINDLEGLPPQFEVRSEEQALKGAVKQFHGIVREQGQVMSAALSNNESLWNTNKALRTANQVLRDRVAELEAACVTGNAELMRLEAFMKEHGQLEMVTLLEENATLKAQNTDLRTEMIRQLTPELDTDARKAKLEALAAQRVELEATGFVPLPRSEDEPQMGPIQPETNGQAGA